MALRQFLLFVLAPLCLALALQSLGDVGTRDSIAYWSAVQAFLRGDNPYDPEILLQIQRTVIPHANAAQLFLNPPWVIPLLTPIFLFKFSTSSFILLCINISLSLFTLRRLGKLFRPLPPRYLMIVGGFFPILSCWYFGQLSCFLLLGSILSLEWVAQNYQPWWKVGLALALFSIKPQTPYLLCIVLGLSVLRSSARADLAKIALLAALPISLLAYRRDIFMGWISSFAHSTQWATSSLPSLAYSVISFVKQPILLILPALILALIVIKVERNELTPHRFIWYLFISSLTAPYAWIFDFSPLVIVTYAVMSIAIHESTSLTKRAAYIAVLAALCIPFEGLFTNDLQAYALHPILVAALLFFAREDVGKFFVATAKR